MAEQAGEKKKASPKKGVKKPLYLGLKIVGTDGMTVGDIKKTNIQVVYATRNSAIVVEKMEANSEVINVKVDVE